MVFKAYAIDTSLLLTTRTRESYLSVQSKSPFPLSYYELCLAPGTRIELV